MTRTIWLFVVFLSLGLSAQEVSLELHPVEHPDGAKVLVANATVTNHTDRDLTNVRVKAQLAYGQKILAGQSDDTWSCRDAGTLQSVQCTAAVLPAGQSVPLTFYIDALLGRFRLQAQAMWDDDQSTTLIVRDAWFPHDIHVTHDRDEGEGSLRHAIRLANEDCEGLLVPCRIVFDEAMTIRPQTPLPVIWGMDIAVDGGGRVTLDGSQVSGGSGLEIEGSIGIAPLVRGLTIRGFPWDGVHVKRAGTIVEDCTIEANGSRGITTSAGEVRITGNRIRRQGRSGLFILGHSALIENNDIEFNGASGIFMHRDWSLVARNRITGNAHFGVAISRSVGRIFVNENSISRNRISAIDRGLDGFDGYRYDDYDPQRAYIPPPFLDEARYDAATNTTTIRGRYFNERDHWGTWLIEVYSNVEPEAQGQTFLGTTSAANGVFTLSVDGDLRGKFITANGHRRIWLGLSGDWWWPSEFGEIVEVR